MLSAVTDADRCSSPWMRAAQEAAVVVAETALGLANAVFTPVAPPKSAFVCAYIPVMIPGGGLQIGVLADPASSRILAAGLLSGGPEDELSEGDIADAIGEIANMVAGTAKAARATTSTVVTLGLPLIVHGWVGSNDRTEIECASASIGGATLTIVVLQSRQPLI